jgi:hypothetical protein
MNNMQEQNLTNIYLSILSNAIEYGATLSRIQLNINIVDASKEKSGIVAKMVINCCDRPDKYRFYLHSNGRAIMKITNPQTHKESQVYCTKLPNTIDYSNDRNMIRKLEGAIGATLSNVFREHMYD